MWKDLYCFALRTDMVLPDWRGFVCLARFARTGSIDLKLALQPHILKGSDRSVTCCCYFQWFMLLIDI